MPEGADDGYVIVPKTNDNACSGPNHGNSDAMPKGVRRWSAGTCLSLTQTFEAGETYNIFCGPTCLCDFHGNFAALLQSAPEGNNPPGRFTLVWIGLQGTTVGIYDDWDALTKHIGAYQKDLIEKGII